MERGILRGMDSTQREADIAVSKAEAQGEAAETSHASDTALAKLVRERQGTAGHVFGEGDVDRLMMTVRALPPPPASVLDVGCGTGVLADAAIQVGYRAVGVDIDAEAMRQMQAPHLVAGIEQLPFPDRSFDVLVANEVLEHLPAPIFTKGCEEMARVAKSVIVVTVPNSESLESACTRCPECGCVYSIHGHVRRFGRDSLPELFEGFRISGITTVGPFKVRHRLIEWYIRRRLLGLWPKQPGSTCPQCHATQPGHRPVSEVQAARGIGRVVRLLAGFPWQRWWFVARYDRSA